MNHAECDRDSGVCLILDDLLSTSLTTLSADREGHVIGRKGFVEVRALFTGTEYVIEGVSLSILLTHRLSVTEDIRMRFNNCL